MCFTDLFWIMCVSLFVCLCVLFIFIIKQTSKSSCFWFNISILLFRGVRGIFSRGGGNRSSAHFHYFIFNTSSPFIYNFPTFPFTIFFLFFSIFHFFFASIFQVGERKFPGKKRQGAHCYGLLPHCYYSPFKISDKVTVKTQALLMERVSGF